MYNCDICINQSEIEIVSGLLHGWFSTWISNWILKQWSFQVYSSFHFKLGDILQVFCWISCISISIIFGWQNFLGSYAHYWECKQYRLHSLHFYLFGALLFIKIGKKKFERIKLSNCLKTLPSSKKVLCYCSHLQMIDPKED